MKRYLLLFVILALCLGVLTGCEPTQTPETSAQTTESTGEETIPAPDVTVYTVDGQSAKLSDFFGKPIVLNFWASWCPPCKAEMPDFEKVYQEMGDQVQFLMVNLTDGTQETVETASVFIKDSGFTFPVYYDTSMEAATAYWVSSIPTTYFIDSNGNLITGANGMLSEENFCFDFVLIPE